MTRPFAFGAFRRVSRAVKCLIALGLIAKKRNLGERFCSSARADVRAFPRCRSALGKHRKTTARVRGGPLEPRSIWCEARACMWRVGPRASVSTRGGLRGHRRRFNCILPARMGRPPAAPPSSCRGAARLSPAKLPPSRWWYWLRLRFWSSRCAISSRFPSWGACGCLFGLFVAGHSHNHSQAIQFANVILLPSILLSGFVFPREFLKFPIDRVSSILPALYLVALSREIILRGTSAADLLPKRALRPGLRWV